MLWADHIYTTSSLNFFHLSHSIKITGYCKISYQNINPLSMHHKFYFYNYNGDTQISHNLSKIFNQLLLNIPKANIKNTKFKFSGLHQLQTKKASYIFTALNESLSENHVQYHLPLTWTNNTITWWDICWNLRSRIMYSVIVVINNPESQFTNI